MAGVVAGRGTGGSFVYGGWGGCSVMLGTQETPIGWNLGCGTDKGTGGKAPSPPQTCNGTNQPCSVTSPRSDSQSD